MMFSLYKCFSLLVFVQNGWTALHVASRNGRFEIVVMLLKAKTNVNVMTEVSHIDGVTVH